MAIEVESISVRPVKGGFIVSVSTEEKYVDDGGEKHEVWDSEDIVALTKDAALAIISERLP